MCRGLQARVIHTYRFIDTCENKVKAENSPRKLKHTHTLKYCMLFHRVHRTLKHTRGSLIQVNHSQVLKSKHNDHFLLQPNNMSS